eukprot:TRINITY_DN74678_c0_g1_i1.p1 TRINITY_DN74678_c0_g1~~TRINITY_DN74678_c0_g1_i1.p1  ORF type:complete len:262 (+),score=8.85 TRINITY_DN74678_c0_g1_i1:111-896(+)
MCKQATETISVIDPANRTGKIELDLSAVFQTVGLQQFMNKKGKNTKKTWSLCMLFQKGKCRAGKRCHQIHAEKEKVNALRAQASGTSTCCMKHGDLRSQETEFLHKLSAATNTTFCLVLSNTEHRALPSTLLARTLALERLLNETASDNRGPIEIDSRRVCRLHAQSRCLFGRDCKSFHVCREALDNIKPAKKESDSFVFSFPSLSSEFSDTSSSCSSSLGHSSEEEFAKEVGNFSPVTTQTNQARPFVNYRAHLFGVSLD